MKKMTYKATSVLLAAILLSGIASGCAKSTTNSSSSTANSESSGASSSETSTAEKGKEHYVSETPTTIRMFIGDRADSPLSPDLPVLAELQKRTNVKLEFDIAPATSVSEKFNLMMASGNLPDTVSYTIEKIMQYSDKGAFEPLNDLLEKDAPNFTKYLEENPNSRKELNAVDGKIYTFPLIAAIPNEFVYLVRQDWLDNLGLKYPTTLDELTEVLKAFRDKDPNGNGQKDEIPYVISPGGGNAYGGGNYYNINLYESFGIYSDFFIKDNKVQYDAIDPAMKDYLAYVNMLYSEKLMDQEFITMDAQLWKSRMTNSVGGMTFNWNTYVDIFTDALKQGNPAANVSGMLPPKGPSGEVNTRHQMKAIRGNGTAIATSAKNKEEIVKFFDYIYSDEGTELMNWGIEGDTYTKTADGKFSYTDKILKDPDSAQIALFRVGINRLNYRQMAEYEDAFVGDGVRAARDMYTPIIINPYPSLKFTEDEQKTITKKMTELQTYRDEGMLGFITGSKPLSEFDSFVEKLKDMGIQEVIDIHQKAYDRYQNG